MIFDHTIIPFVLAGKTTTTTLPLDRKRLPRKGRSYAIRSRTPAVRDEDGRITKPIRITTVTRVIISSIKKSVEHQAWVITFELDHAAPPRLMHQQSERGYTTQRREALEPDADAIDSDTLERYAKENQERHEARQRAQAEAPLHERVRLLLDAQAAGIDVSRPLAVIRRYVEAGEKKYRRAA